jgi:hypothetical protein
MRTRDENALLAPKSRVTRPAKQRDGEFTASRALATGTTHGLDSHAVLHLQRMAGNMSVSRLLAGEETQGESPVKDVVGKGGGKPLDVETRSFMEPRIGADLEDVRVHDDGKASDSAKSVGAHAYTVGSDVVFQSGMYSPGNPTSQRMLAHELTHVVQQRSGPVAGTPQKGGINVSDPSDSFEQAAEANADKVMSMSSAPAGPAQGGGGGGASVQREGEEEVQERRDPSLQRMSVQREGEEEVQEMRDPSLQRMSVQREGEEEVQEMRDPSLQRMSVQREGEEEVQEIADPSVQRLVLQREEEEVQESADPSIQREEAAQDEKENEEMAG